MQHTNHDDIHEHNENVNSMSSSHLVNHGNEGLFLSYTYLGIYLLCLGIWWWIQALRQHYSTIKHNHNHNEPYTTTVSIGSRCCCKHRLGGGLCKLICCIIGIGVELITLKLGRHHEYAQFPFYTAMLLVGLLDIFMCTIIVLPKGFDSMIYALPFFVQTYCLRAQSYQQPHITETCCLLISYWGFIVGCSIIHEMMMMTTMKGVEVGMMVGVNKSLLWTWIKCFSVMIHGSWICQSGFLLNSPFNQAWDESDHDKVMLTVVIFVWHMFIVMIGQLLLLIVMAKCYGVSSDWTEMTNSSTRKTPSYKYDRESLNKSNSTNQYDNIEYTQLLNTDYIE
ncbi:unnamed protein product [Schistosoma margrebowiei]|uniref:Transmembrane protein 45B n=1 Tax=Schistosoma margrebowiei TaxID=48269 RepID=A0AA85A0F5_9TREM|nr:unnamed protein product [Schistosoma margrebowiei]